MDGEDNRTERAVVSPGRVLGGVRSASPAKRSATDMEDGGHNDLSPAGVVPGSFAKDAGDRPSHFDEAMASMSNGGDAMDTQQSVGDSMDTSVDGTLTTNSSATSFQSDGLPPPYSAEDTGPILRADTNYTQKEIDMQQARVIQKMQSKQMEEGDKGMVVSQKWLARILSRSSEGLKNSEYSKESREGPIGPVDNSDIVADGGFDDPILIDQQKQKFFPLKPGLTMTTDYEVFNDAAWGEVVGAYGMKSGQQVISRYAKNTTDSEIASNIQYEIYPPVFTIRKVAQPGQLQDDDGGKRPTSSSSFERLRLKDEGRGRGQLSPDDAVRLVSSRQEKFQKFLARSKEAAGIQRSTKVKIWKLLDPSQSDADTGMSANASSSAVQTKPITSTKLILPNEEFDKLEIGRDLDLVDVKDLTNDTNYNGSTNMESLVLGESHTLVLEEQIGGPGGGEFASAKKKPGPLFKLAKKDGGSKPGSAPASGRTSPAPQGGMITRGRARRDGRTRGVVGLTNLGNTCYMNSALQCIRSVEELAIYFLSEKYKQEINMNNPLGHKGVMAKQYANLLSQLYGDISAGAVTPSAFKKTIGNMQPMFSGYGQQDSQEFLSFLVDALHEDLNRIQKKPYNENPDSDDSTVNDPQAIIDLGEIYRKNHKARNESIAMDLFSGFYKNTMECPECNKISITFDPYSLLTVQLPIENTFQHNITFISQRDRPVNHIIDMDKNATIKTLKEYIASKHPGVQADRLWMIECYSHKVYKVFDDTATLAEAGIQTNDFIFIYELDHAPSNPPPPEKKSYTYTSYWNKRDDEVPDMDDAKADQFAVPIFSRQKNRFGSGFDVILHPMYITVTREEAQDYDIILKKVLIAMTRLTSRPLLAEESDKEHISPPADEMDRDDQVTDGNAQVNDTSSSEDGYVNVSLKKSEQNDDAEAQTNGVDEDDRSVPSGFMDPEYFVSPALRNQLFELNYARGENVYCASMSSFKDPAQIMFDRVKQPARRGSIDSSSSSEEGSTTSTGDDTQVNGDAEESDDGDLDRPDITLGGESYMSFPTPVGDDDDDNVSTAENTFGSRKGRRKNRKGGKRRGNKQKTYGKNKKNQGGLINQGRQMLGLKPSAEDPEDNPFYIKLGEAIVLNWYPEALDNLFNGNRQDPDALRGHFVSTDDGKGLPFFDDPAVKEKKERRETRKKNGITLDDCFVETGKREVLSQDNAWYCNRCKELRQATKTLEIWTIPDILVVHLKRFGGTRSFRDKIDVLVDYPIEGLDMTNRIGLKEDGKEYVYDLFAVDNHFGGLGGGHYTAFAKNFYDGQWYDYNDSHASKIGENRLHSAAAYLLFYRRRSEKPLGPQYLQDLVLDARNPPAADEAENAEESDSGEGRLGGPNGSTLPSGSSSGLTGAGAGVGIRPNGGSSGAGLGAGNSLMTRSQPIEIEGLPKYGPVLPPHLRNKGQSQYGNQGSTWNFNSLETETEMADAGGAADNLLDNVDDDGDAGSMDANMDLDDDNDANWEDAAEWRPSAGRNTPVHSSPTFTSEFEDDHAMYSSTHEQLDDALHLEDAGMTGEQPETVEIYPDPPTPGRVKERSIAEEQAE